MWKQWGTNSQGMGKMLLPPQKNAYVSLSSSFCFSGKSSHTLKPINHFCVCVLTLPLLKQIDSFRTLIELLHSA